MKELRLVYSQATLRGILQEMVDLQSHDPTRVYGFASTLLLNDDGTVAEIKNSYVDVNNMIPSHDEKQLQAINEIAQLS